MTHPNQMLPPISYRAVQFLGNGGYAGYLKNMERLKKTPLSEADWLAQQQQAVQANLASTAADAAGMNQQAYRPATPQVTAQNPIIRDTVNQSQQSYITHRDRMQAELDRLLANGTPSSDPYVIELKTEIHNTNKALGAGNFSAGVNKQLLDAQTAVDYGNEQAEERNRLREAVYQGTTVDSAGNVVQTEDAKFAGNLLADVEGADSKDSTATGGDAIIEQKKPTVWETEDPKTLDEITNELWASDISRKVAQERKNQRDWEDFNRAATIAQYGTWSRHKYENEEQRKRDEYKASLIEGPDGNMYEPGSSMTWTAPNGDQVDIKITEDGYFDADGGKYVETIPGQWDYILGGRKVSFGQNMKDNIQAGIQRQIDALDAEIRGLEGEGFMGTGLDVGKLFQTYLVGAILGGRKGGIAMVSNAINHRRDQLTTARADKKAKMKDMIDHLDNERTRAEGRYDTHVTGVNNANASAATAVEELRKEGAADAESYNKSISSYKGTINQDDWDTGIQYLQSGNRDYMNKGHRMLGRILLNARQKADNSIKTTGQEGTITVDGGQLHGKSYPTFQIETPNGKSWQTMYNGQMISKADLLAIIKEKGGTGQDGQGPSRTDMTAAYTTWKNDIQTDVQAKIEALLPEDTKLPSGLTAADIVNQSVTMFRNMGFNVNDPTVLANLDTQVLEATEAMVRQQLQDPDISRKYINSYIVMNQLQAADRTNATDFYLINEGEADVRKQKLVDAKLVAQQYRELEAYTKLGMSFADQNRAFHLTNKIKENFAIFSSAWANMTDEQKDKIKEKYDPTDKENYQYLWMKDQIAEAMKEKQIEMDK